MKEEVETRLDFHFSEWGGPGAAAPVEVGFLCWCWDTRGEVLGQLEAGEYGGLANEIQPLVDGWYTCPVPGSLETADVYLEVSLGDVETWLKDRSEILVARLQAEC